MSHATGSPLESFLAALRHIAILLMLLGPASRGAAAQESKPAPAPGAPTATAPGTGAALPPAGPATTVVVTASPIETQEQMELVFEQFYKVALDLEKPLAVHGLTLTRDSMELKLDDG